MDEPINANGDAFTACEECGEPVLLAFAVTEPTHDDSKLRLFHETCYQEFS